MKRYVSKGRKRARTASSKPKSRLTVKAPAAKIWTPVSQKPGFGNDMDTTFIYSTKFSINPGTLGLATVYQFNLNSLFDPDLTGVGTQPIPLDQYAALYERYRVYETSFKIVFFSGDSTNNMICGYNICDQATATTDLERLIQNGQCEWAPLGRVGGSTDCAVFVATCDLAKAHGISRQRLMSDDLYAATMASSPAESMVLNCFVAAVDNADPGAGNCYIEIRYKAKLEGNQLITVS